MKKDRKPQKAGGFTLIELLVVFGIIAILAALLLPALSNAKAKAQTIHCLNNLKQLQVAWSLYADDYNDHLPPNWSYGNEAGGTPETGSWVSGMMTYETLPQFAPWYSYSTNTLKLVPGGYGSIGAYTKNPAIYKCPSDKSWILIAGGREARVRSVTMNEYMDSLHREDGAYDYRFRKMREILPAGPSRVWVFIDSHEDSTISGWFEIPVPTPSFPVPHCWAQLLGGRHRGAATISFADSHVEIKKWRDSRTKVPPQRALYHPTFEENPDAAWLTDRSTALKSP